MACRHGRAAAVRKLLDRGADPNCQNKFGDTPLHLAVASHSREILNLLLACGQIEVDKKNEKGETALMLTVREKLPFGADLIDDLLQAGANPSEKDNEGKEKFFWKVKITHRKGWVTIGYRRESPLGMLG